MMSSVAARAALLGSLAILACVANTGAIEYGGHYPAGRTEAEVSGTAVDFLDVGTAQYEDLVDFNDYFLNATGLASQQVIVFSDANHRLMTEYMAETLTALAQDSPETIAVVQGFEPRPATVTRPPTLVDIGRGLHLRYLSNGNSPARLENLANRTIDAGFDFVAIPTGSSYVNVSTPNNDCGRNAVDLLFILDGSGSVGSSNFETMLQFTEAVAAAFDVSPDTTRIGMFVYSSYIYEQFDFNYTITNTKQELLDRIRATTYPGGGTATGGALNFARTTMFQESRGARPTSAGVPRVAIVITDGQSGDSVTTPAEQLRQENVNIFAIGIAGANVYELNEIASEPIEDNVKFISTFSDFAQLPAEISRANCDQPAVVRPTDQIEINNTLPGEIRFFRPNPADISSERINLQVEVVTGQTDVFVSVTTSNPGPFNYDFTIQNDEVLKSLEVSKEPSQLISIAVRSRLSTSARRRATGTISYRLRVLNDLFDAPGAHVISVTPQRNRAGAPIFQAPPAVNYPGTPFVFTLEGPNRNAFEVDPATGRITLRNALATGRSHSVTLVGTYGSTVGGVSLQVQVGESTTLPPSVPQSNSNSNGNNAQVGTSTDGDSDTDAGLIAGAVVGGVVGLIIVVAIVAVIAKNAGGGGGGSSSSGGGNYRGSSSTSGSLPGERNSVDMQKNPISNNASTDTRHNPAYGFDA